MKTFRETAQCDLDLQWPPWGGPDQMRVVRAHPGAGPMAPEEVAAWVSRVRNADPTPKRSGSALPAFWSSAWAACTALWGQRRQ